MTLKKPRLGRGLETLLGELSTLNSGDNDVRPPREGELQALSLDILQRGKYQPRKEFTEEALAELADSIRAQGVIQPIIVRSVGNGRFEIIAGERRFRAAKLAGLTTIPALVREIPDEAAMAFALIENIQRENLNPLEEAVALQRLIEEFGLTHQAAAQIIGKSRVSVSNLLRLLSLNHQVKVMLEQGQLEMGHARALLGLESEQQLEVALRIVAKKLSVRETEEIVRLGVGPAAERKASVSATTHPELASIEKRLLERLLLPVKIQQNAKGRGKVVIRYKSARELQRLLDVVN